MHWIDWLFVIIPFLIVGAVAFKGQKYLKGVADFLAAGRVAGRYVICVAGGEAGMGLISAIALVEMYYNCGFAMAFWSNLIVLLGLLFALTGYCTYRFRETRALTMGQFLEIRYNRPFRIFAAVLQSVSGIINYAIFPAVGARFMIYFLDLPVHFELFGFRFQTVAILMLLFLGVALLIATLGGQITIMATDCIQGILSYPMYVAIVVFFLWKFSWSEDMVPALLNRAEGESFLNPYNIEKLRDFNLFYIVVGLFSGTLNRMTWSGTQGYNVAARNAHEQKMGGLLGTWRAGFSMIMLVLMAVAAITYLNHPHFSREAREVRTQLAGKTLEDVVPGLSAAEKQSLKRDYMAIPEETVFKAAGSPETVRELEEIEKKSPRSYAVVKLPKKLCASCEALRRANRPVSASCPDCATVSQSYSGDAAYLAATQSGLEKIPEAKGKIGTFNTIFKQMLVPVTMREILPGGLTGVFFAIMLTLMISTDTAYMHSWGSILAQDLILPFRKKPFTTKQQLFLLRACIVFVCAFAFTFSLLFAQMDYILMFFAITGAIWAAGAGSCIVFGLYWKKGTTAGAFTSLIAGASLAVGGILLQYNWAQTVYPFLARYGMVDTVAQILRTISRPFAPYIVWEMNPYKFPINSMELTFFSILSSMTLYIVVSLLTVKKDFNMDKMLHRGIYSSAKQELKKVPFTLRGVILKLVGIDRQYTTGDKFLAWSVFAYTFGYGFIGCFVVVVIWNQFFPWPDAWWAHYFFITNIVVAGIIGIVSTIWFSICGTRDLVRMFRDLDNRIEDDSDDGRVTNQEKTSEEE